MRLFRLTVRQLLLLTLLLISGGLALSKDRGCDLVPPYSTIGHPARPGDNGFTILLSGDPEKFVPGEAYIVTLKNINNEGAFSHRFTAFSLMIEPDNPGRAGTFEIIDHATTQFVVNCPTTIIHTSSSPKLEVSVRWRAPQENSGCVQFKALIVEQSNVWHMAEGGLIKKLCEEEFEPYPITEGCKACSEAKYEITFEGLWSRQTHPTDFPPADAGFSDIIGVSHSGLYSMWEKGTKASNGIQQIARDGETSILETEFVNNSDAIRTIIKARGLKYSNTKSFAVFRVDQEHHLLSIMSKVTPSPDWIVGKSNFDLCKEDKWIEGETVDLLPIDAGIDAAITYKEKNPLPKSEYDKIRDITSSFPNDDKSPFFDKSGAKINPLARLIITKKRQYDIPCSNADLGPVCETSQWSPFSSCSVSCGQGYKTRKRSYKLGGTIGMCNKVLIQKEPCTVRCENDRPISSQQNSGRSVKCAVTEWSTWSSCSPACGKGIRNRTRNYLDKTYEKYCTLKTMDEEACQSYSLCGDTEPCAISSWSDWSPCTVTCGKGTIFRTRKLLNDDNEKGCHVSTIETKACLSDKGSCVVDPEEKSA